MKYIYFARAYTRLTMWCSSSVSVTAVVFPMLRNLGLDSTPWIPVFVIGTHGLLETWILNSSQFSGIPDSFRCIPAVKAQDSGFHAEQNFTEIRIPLHVSVQFVQTCQLGSCRS